MHIAVNLVPGTLARELSLFEGGPVTYVVVDILRASTVICTALSHGAESVIPVGDIEAARVLLGRTDMRNAMLCGERGGRKLDGFDLGNSPAEYTTEKVGGRTLIFASTNGSVALTAAPRDATVLVGGLVNVSALAHSIVQHDQPVLIACAGKENGFSLEDAVGAGAIISKLWETDPELELVNDGARAAQVLWDQYKSDPVMPLWQSQHGIYLIEIGFGADLSVCGAIDSVPIVPILRDGRIVAEPPISPFPQN
ncbi:MAG: 2-phosphosulfolactate phosphatase [candidate division Zixibacteria bacterium]|nr:2-phosphosulfolactate phosphatase [candidate division Zixibacteria bacterium]